MFKWKSHACFKIHFGQNDLYEIQTGLSFISPQFIWTQVKSWLNTKVKFSTETNSYTGLSSFRSSCERTLSKCSAKYIQQHFQKLNSSPCALFHMKTRVSLKYFVTDCSLTIIIACAARMGRNDMVLKIFAYPTVTVVYFIDQNWSPKRWVV